MSQIAEIADHFLSRRVALGPRRFGFIGTQETIPAAFLAANLALRWTGSGKQVMVLDGEREEVNLGSLLGRQPLPLLGEGNLEQQAGSSLNGVDLVPFCLSPDTFQDVSPSQWELLGRHEGEADLFLVTLPGDTALFLWTPIIRSLHAVVLQTPIRDQDVTTCYKILRFLYFHNPFLRVYLVAVPSEKGKRTPVSEGMSFYDHLSEMVQGFLQQEMVGPYLMVLETDLVQSLLDQILPQGQPSSLALLLERLAQELLNQEPPIEKQRFPSFFASLKSVNGQSETSLWDGHLLEQVEGYFPLESEVGPGKVSLLLSWERRLAVGEMVRHGLGDSLVRGIVSLEWVHEHLPLLARLYGKKVNATLSPHLVLLSPSYPESFCRGIARLDTPIVLYRTIQGRTGTCVERVSSELTQIFSNELSTKEKEALQFNPHKA